MRQLSIDVVIPVQNMAEQLADCIGPLLEQCGERDSVTLVDDASTDETARVARELGARVLSLAESAGPYRARQQAANESRADVLLFIDGRCRPLDGLLDSHRDMQNRPGVALSCTDTKTRSGPSLAARVAARRQLFSLHHFIGIPRHLDYYPTANLGVRRSAFQSVNGFRAMRSGADADLCWRIQQAELGTMAIDSRCLMEWEPRTSMRDLASQSFRYGKSYAYLQWISAREQVFRDAQSASERGKNHRPPKPAVDDVLLERIASGYVSAVFQVGYALSKRQHTEFKMPEPYELGDNN